EAGDPERARRYRQKSATALRKSGANRGWKLAEWLEAPTEFDYRGAMDLTCPSVELKALALCVLVDSGCRERLELLELADRLNYQPQFPGRFLKRQIQRLRK
ncbi:MAG: hypothetical protein NT069_15410, partial [Planctomycetota bacterium]|nr:hypothetical protein [Planctomycetota bacterium]